LCIRLLSLLSAVPPRCHFLRPWSLSITGPADMADGTRHPIIMKPTRPPGDVAPTSRPQMSRLKKTTSGSQTASGVATIAARSVSLPGSTRTTKLVGLTVIVGPSGVGQTPYSRFRKVQHHRASPHRRKGVLLGDIPTPAGCGCWRWWWPTWRSTAAATCHSRLAMLDLEPLFSVYMRLSTDQSYGESVDFCRARLRVCTAPAGATELAL
jgi:hypothetical protein